MQDLKVNIAYFQRYRRKSISFFVIKRDIMQRDTNILQNLQPLSSYTHRFHKSFIRVTINEIMRNFRGNIYVVFVQTFSIIIHKCLVYVKVVTAYTIFGCNFW
uniref:Orf 00986 protein n=1 Tax=Saccharomyces cerevisiae TaxID=4932 RepID=E9PA67_YEASX|nr:orf 00986 [Saccharomyces cerevisiae]